MVLTPADVHNVAFSRPRLGHRGYNEQEVDLFIDLVEQELIRHIEEDAELRNRNAELRSRNGGLQKREAKLAKQEEAFHQHEVLVRQHEDELRQQQALIAKREADITKLRPPLPQQVAQLRYREAQVAQRESQVAQHDAQLAQHDAQLAQQESQLVQREGELREQEAELADWEAELRQQEAELRQQEAELRQREAELDEQEEQVRLRVDQQEAVASCVGAEGATTNQVPRRLRSAHQLRAAASKPAAVNGASRLEEARTVASVHGRHDMERMAIRAVTDTLGNRVTEAVHERTRRSAIDNGGLEVASEQSAELQRLIEENAELARSLRMMKSAAALLAAALDQP
jgi:DivIVA domain-containing protein